MTKKRLGVLVGMGYLICSLPFLAFTGFGILCSISKPMKTYEVKVQIIARFNSDRGVRRWRLAIEKRKPLLTLIPLKQVRSLHGIATDFCYAHGDELSLIFPECGTNSVRIFAQNSLLHCSQFLCTNLPSLRQMFWFFHRVLIIGRFYASDVPVWIVLEGRGFLRATGAQSAAFLAKYLAGHFCAVSSSITPERAWPPLCARSRAPNRVCLQPVGPKS